MKTKQKAGWLLVLIFMSAQAFGQLQVGPQIGLGASTQSELGNIWQNDNLCCGLSAGAVARYSLNDWFALKSGLFFAQKGRAVEDADETYQFNYLELPVKAEFSALIQPGKASRLFFATGPYLAGCLKASYEHHGAKTDILDDVPSTDMVTLSA